MSLSSLDLAIVVAYLFVVTGVGAFFARRGESADRFMAAGRSLPGWAIGLSILYMSKGACSKGQSSAPVRLATSASPHSCMAWSVSAPIAQRSPI